MSASLAISRLVTEVRHRTNSGNMYGGAYRKGELGTIYAIELGDGGPVKVGFTSQNDPRERMVAVANERSVPRDQVFVVAQFIGTIDDEARLHFLLRNHKIGPETYRPDPEVVELLRMPSQKLRQFMQARVPNAPTAKQIAAAPMINAPAIPTPCVVKEKIRLATKTRRVAAILAEAQPLIEELSVNKPDTFRIAEIAEAYSVTAQQAHFVWVLERFGRPVRNEVVIELISPGSSPKLGDVIACKVRKKGVPIGNERGNGSFLTEPLKATRQNNWAARASVHRLAFSRAIGRET